MKAFFTPRYIVLLCVSIAIAYYFVSNTQRFKKENAQLKTEINELKKQWINLRVREGEIAFAAQEIVRLQEQREEIQRELAGMTTTMRVEQESIVFLQKEMDKLFFRQREKVRKEAKGARFKKMTTPEGRTYEDIEIIEVRPDGLSFRFGSDSASAAGLGLHQISDEWIDRFMYTDEEVNAACAKAGVKPRKKK